MTWATNTNNMNPDLQDFNTTPPVPQRNFYGQGKFPQPFVVACGYITSAGAVSTFVLPETLTVAKTATGVYKITHYLGLANKYIVLPTATGTTGFIITTANIGAESVEVRTFDADGAAADSAFSFVIYSF